MPHDFYVNLSSDACLDIYPSNESSDFTIQLAAPIVLETFGEGTWTCGLSSIQFGHDWDNIDSKSNQLWLTHSLTEFKMMRRKHIERSESDQEPLYWVFNETVYMQDTSKPILTIP